MMMCEACGYPTQYILVIYIPIEQYTAATLSLITSLYIHSLFSKQKKVSQTNTHFKRYNNTLTLKHPQSPTCGKKGGE